MKLKCGSRLLDLSSPVVMGILNVTPDSFSDGGELYQDKGLSVDKVLRRAEAMLSEGAQILDVGGESTRPGAEPVSVQEELDRVLPVVEALDRRLDCVVSVDTSTPELMLASARLGAGMINDVRALQRPGAAAAAADSGLPVCLMHMQGEPDTMQNSPRYEQVLDEVSDFLAERVKVCQEAGIAADQLLLDPGFGFGKSLDHNLLLLKHLDRFVATGLPVLAGLSRKSMIAHLLGRDVDKRMPASIALALIAVQKGAHIVRVHDVAETSDALRINQALRLLGE